MKIVEINGTNYSSTGNIMLNIASEARKQGFDVFTCSKNSKKANEFKYDNHIFIGSRLERVLCEELAYLSGYQNYFNYFGTKAFIQKLKEIKPDLIHMHIMHDTYINLRMLFDYIKENNIPIVWTFHDCWAFTGRCPYFDNAKCDKWKSECFECPQLDKYPQTKVDKSKLLWNKKKKWFTGIKNMTIVTPSKWLSGFIKDSYLNEYQTKVIRNGINLDVFKPVDSDFKKEHNILDKHMILGVGYNWAPRKGLNDFIELSKKLPSNYQIVLIGTNDEIDKKLPENIISIHRTYNVQELVKIYSAADVFVNPTYEDNFPTVNIESLACGTPVLTYETGGSPEAIDEKCGSVISKGNIEALEKEITRVCQENAYSKQDCINRSEEFDATNKYNEYVELYKEILNK